MSDMKAETYLIIEGRRPECGPVNPSSKLRDVDSARVVGVSASLPSKLARNQIAVRIELEVGASNFDPIMPIAVIQVPDSLSVRGPIGATAVDPGVTQGPYLLTGIEEPEEDDG